MSAFRELLSQAESLGVTKLVFDVNLAGYNEEDQIHRWSCRASVASPAPVLMEAMQASGRTGEEALRFVVEFLQRTA